VRVFLSSDDGKTTSVGSVGNDLFVSKADLKQGDFAEWNSSGGKARGKITRIVREGTLDVPGADFKVNAEEDDPAVLLTVYRPFGDGFRATPTKVGHKMSTLRRIAALKVVEGGE
jgi:hypothetical protein